MSKWITARRAEQQGLPATPAPPAPPPPPPPRAIAPPPPPPPPPAARRADWVSVMRQRQEESGIPMGTLEEEVARILSLPMVDPEKPRCPDPAAYEASLVLPDRPDGFHLRPVQVDGIWTFETYGGLLAQAAVGTGKSLIAMGCAIRAIRSRGHYRAVIMIPPEVFGQFVDQDIPWARQRIDFSGLATYPVRGTARQRREIARQPGNGIWIYSYSSLSSQTGYEELEAINATCYVLDEAHNVTNPKSSRTKRWNSAMTQQEKDGTIEKVRRLMGDAQMKGLECAVMSGTVTKKKVADYAHLAHRALGSLSPAPTRGGAIHAFGQIIDAEATGAGLAANDREAAALRQYLDWATQVRIPLEVESQDGRQRVVPTVREQVQIAYRERLRRSAGVIVTADQDVDASLIIGWFEPPWSDEEGLEHMVALMRQVVHGQTTPNGDAIDYGMHQYKWLWELSAGFYNQLIWPTAEEVMRSYPEKWGRTISMDEAEMMLHAAWEHHEHQQAYYKELREFLDYNHIPGCDSPMLVAAEIARQIEGHDPNHRIHSSLIEAYVTQRDCGPERYPDLPERYSIPVRVTDYKIKAAVTWAQNHQKSGGIMWYHHPEIGRWVHEALIAADIPHTYAPAGENEKAYAKGLVLASFAHGTGKNLQYQQHQNLFIELRREAYVMEQTLGRTHRSGQPKDSVRADLMIGNGFDLALFNGTLNDADYAQSTMGSQYRLCYATYDPVIPPINPRLMLKLGIIKNIVRTPATAAWEQITPPSIEDVADLLRPIAWGTGRSVKTSS